MTTEDDLKKDDEERVTEWEDSKPTQEQAIDVEWTDSKPTDLVPAGFFDEGHVVEIIADSKHQTAPHSIADMPGYEPGFYDGRKRGIADAMDALRVALMEVGLDAGEAFTIAQKVGRRIGVHGT